MTQMYSVPVPAQPNHVNSTPGTPVIGPIGQWALPPDSPQNNGGGGYFFNGQQSEQPMWSQQAPQAPPYHSMACIIPVMAVESGTTGMQAFSPTNAGMQRFDYDNNGNGNWTFNQPINGQFQFAGNAQPNGFAMQQAQGQMQPQPMACAVPASPQPRNGVYEGPPTAWIVNRLIEREKARMEKRWEEADGIRADLRRRGIEVEDRDRIWKCKDGRRGQRPNHNDSLETVPVMS